MAYRIVAFGEVLWDLLPTGPCLGGAPFNFAYRLASLGDRGTMVSRVGRDDLGDRALECIGGLGMDARCIQRDPVHPTGTVPVRLGHDGTPDFTILPDVAYDYIEPTPAALAAAAEADCICFGTLIWRGEVSRRTLAELLRAFRGRLRLLDLNLRRDCWTPDRVRSSIEAADVLKLNDAEAGTVSALLGLGVPPSPELASALFARTGLSHVVITLGERGAYAASRGGAAAYVPGFVVDVVDTVGSGDAFTAGFAHGLLAGWPLDRAVACGNALGALVAGQRGATEPLALADVDRLLASGRSRPADPRFTEGRRARIA